MRGSEKFLPLFVGALVFGSVVAVFALELRYALLIAGAFFGLTGWLIAAGVFTHHRRMLSRIKSVVGSHGGHEDVVEDLSSYLHDLRRYYRAAFGIPLDKNISQDELGKNLTQLSNLALEQFEARSVEIALFDENSGMWSKAFISGLPCSAESQGMSAAEAAKITGPISIKSRDGYVLRAPIRFAGTTFGDIRIELVGSKEPSPSDLKVLRLVAIQSAIAILNSRFTTELIRMKHISEESVKAKTGFLATLSHEIRGPLGIILNGVEVILEGLCGPLTENAKETLGMIKGSGEHLLDLVNDVLDYAKVEAGKITPKPINLPVKQLLDDLMNVVRAQAETKKHKLVLENVESTIGIRCDKRHARQMLINFLTNAIKYTPDGGTITVRGELVGETVKISIKDTGVGIPKEQRSRVFAPFERVDNQYSQAQQGTGLGMPLTKRLAEANGGEVDFDSEEGSGSTFWIALPYVEIGKDISNSAGDTGVFHALREGLLGKGESVLLVDPDLNARQMIETYLVHQGFKILSAASGREVVKLLKDQKIDLVILENDLPDLNGEEMVSALRAHPKGATVPIVLLSAKAFVFDIERFLKLGVDRCLAKPVDLNEVAQTTRRLIDDTALPH